MSGRAIRSRLGVVLVGLVVLIGAAVLSGGSGGDAAGAAGDLDAVRTPPTTNPLDATTSSVAAEPTVEPATTLTTTTTLATTTTSSPDADERALADLVASLTPTEKARQLVVTGLGDGDAGAALLASVGSGCPGGVFVADRTGDTAGVRADIAAIRAAGRGCVGGALVMTDAEPGIRVVKVPVPAETLLPPSPDLYARHLADPAAAHTELDQAAGGFAGALRDLGVDVTFGVLSDVDVGDDFYMARQRRSFGSRAPAVAALAATLVERHCAAGVAAALKHFPNQGATPEDPHLGISTSADDEAAWRDRGRVPFVDTVAPLVMTGHIVMRDVDPTLPASLSLPHTTGLLRDDLGYEGVVVTDDLTTMVGVTSVIADAAGRAVQAVAAGADLALFVDPGPHGHTIEAIVERAADDPVFSRRVDESVTRVLRLKAGLGLVDRIDPSAFPICAPGGPPHVPGAPVVVVADGSGPDGLTADAEQRLAALGVATVVTDHVATSRTTVRHVESAAALAAAVADQLGGSADLVAPTTRRAMAADLVESSLAGADVWVVVGADHETALGSGHDPPR